MRGDFWNDLICRPQGDLILLLGPFSFLREAFPLTGE